MISPKGDYILVKVIKEDNNGIVTGDKSESQKGLVIEVGPGVLKRSDDMRTEMFVQPGDTVVWLKYADADFKFDESGETYTLIKIQNIMAVDNE